MAWRGSAGRGGRGSTRTPTATSDGMRARCDGASARPLYTPANGATAWPGGMRQSHSRLGTEERRAELSSELSARRRSFACGRKLRGSVGNGYAEPQQQQYAAGTRAMWPLGVIRRVLREQGTRVLALAQCWLQGGGTCQRRRQCGSRSLCRCIRWTPKAAPTNRVPPVCAQLSARVRHRPSRPCLAREVRRPED
jgi:hypothetical protein